MDGVGVGCGAADDVGADGVDVVGEGDVVGEVAGDGVDDGDALGDGVGEGDVVGDVVGDGDLVGEGVDDGDLVGDGVEGTPVRCVADGDGDGVELVGDVHGLRRVVGVDVGDSTPDGTVGAGEANIEGPAQVPAAAGGRLLNRPADPVRACRPLLRSGTPPMVPVAFGAPLLLGSCAAGAAASRGTRAGVPCRNPGHTNASSSSARNSPAPAAAASRRAPAVAEVPTGATRRWAPGVSRDRASCGTVCRPSVTRSLSSVPAKIGSISGAHLARWPSRLPWQVPHSLRCLVTVSRRAAGNTMMSGRAPSGGSPLR